MSFLMRPITGRSVHLKVHPRPQSLADTKAVLQALRRFGDVETFRHLKYEVTRPAPNSFIVTFMNANSAAKAIAEETIDISYPLLSDDNRAVKQVQQGQNPGSASRPARVAIRESQMDHDQYISRQPYYAKYPTLSRNSLYTDMNQRTPHGLYAMCRLDYDTPELGPRTRDPLAGFREQVMGQGGYMGIWKEAQARMQAEK